MHHNKVTEFSHYCHRLCCQCRRKSGTKSPRNLCAVNAFQIDNCNLAKIFYLSLLNALNESERTETLTEHTFYPLHVYDDDDDSTKSVAFVYLDVILNLNVKWNIYDTLHTILIIKAPHRSIHCSVKIQMNMVDACRDLFSFIALPHQAQDFDLSSRR